MVKEKNEVKKTLIANLSEKQTRIKERLDVMKKLHKAEEDEILDELSECDLQVEALEQHKNK